MWMVLTIAIAGWRIWYLRRLWQSWCCTGHLVHERQSTIQGSGASGPSRRPETTIAGSEVPGPSYPPMLTDSVSSDTSDSEDTALYAIPDAIHAP